jgi:predicted ester cyclase
MILKYDEEELIMDTKETAKEFIEAFNNGDVAKVGSLLAEDFTFSGPVPKPLSKREWVGLLGIFKTAFPDINYNLRFVKAEGNVVTTTSQLTGTHTGNFDMSAMGLGVFPPTGKYFSNTEESGESVVEDGKIKSIHMQGGKGSGVEGILTQLGLQPALK